MRYAQTITADDLHAAVVSRMARWLRSHDRDDVADEALYGEPDPANGQFRYETQSLDSLVTSVLNCLVASDGKRVMERD